VKIAVCIKQVPEQKLKSNGIPERDSQERRHEPRHKPL